MVGCVSPKKDTSAQFSDKSDYTSAWVCLLPGVNHFVREVVFFREIYFSTYTDTVFGKMLQVFKNIFFKTGLKPDFERFLASMAVDHARRDRHALRLAYGPPCE